MAWAVHTESARHGTTAAAGDNGLHEQGSAQIELTWRWPPAGSRACATAGCKSLFPPCLLHHLMGRVGVFKVDDVGGRAGATGEDL